MVAELTKKSKPTSVQSQSTISKISATFLGVNGSSLHSNTTVSGSSTSKPCWTYWAIAQCPRRNTWTYTTFEVGGKNKGQKQIQGIEKSFVVKDDIEFGYANIIPLWQFGMNY